MLRRTEQHYGWLPSQFDMIDWKAHHGVIQKLRFNEKRFVTKSIHQSLPMGKLFHEIDPSQPILCSSCKIHEESDTHLHRCPARQMAMEDTFRGETLGTFLEESHTCPQLAHSLLEAIYCNLEDSRYPAFKNRHGAYEPKFPKLHQLQA
jgi:hypothetical protein